MYADTFPAVIPGNTFTLKKPDCSKWTIQAEESFATSQYNTLTNSYMKNSRRVKEDSDRSRGEQ